MEGRKNMANGQQRAKQSLDAFQAWVATQSDDDFITDRVEPSKPTLWRNIEFRDEYDRVKAC